MLVFKNEFFSGKDTFTCELKMEPEQLAFHLLSGSGRARIAI